MVVPFQTLHLYTAFYTTMNYSSNASIFIQNVSEIIPICIIPIQKRCSLSTRNVSWKKSSQNTGECVKIIQIFFLVFIHWQHSPISNPLMCLNLA